MVDVGVRWARGDCLSFRRKVPAGTYVAAVLLRGPCSVDAINTFRVFPRHFASFRYFRVIGFDVSAAHRYFCDGFDSRQLQLKLAGQAPKFTEHRTPVKTAVKIWGVSSRPVASIRTRLRKDGTVYTSVLMLAASDK